MIDGDTEGVFWSEQHGAYTTRFDDDGYTPSIAVVETLGAALDERPGPLFDYVDPDALDGLVADASESVRVTFEVESATVTVHGDGRVFVRR